MSFTIQHPPVLDVPRPVTAVKPSKVDPQTAKPFTLDQELELFGTWTGEPIWVPPKDSSKAMAETMLRQSSVLRSRAKSWQSVVKAHRTEFTQVREIDLHKASIRLPQGKFFVTVTEQEHFDKITDSIPACVQTRLDEFLAGPGKRWGVKVYYLKPLCIEVGDDLILTTEEQLFDAIHKIQEEVYSEYRWRYLYRRTVEATRGAVNAGLAVPRAFVQFFTQRRQRAIDAYHAKLEFQRRKTAWRAARVHRRCRSHGCTFDEMLDLTNPLEQADVIQQFCIERELSLAKQRQLIRMAAGTTPWFVALSLTASYVSTISLTFAPPILVCDPVFVAEFPDAKGQLLKIGHFDEISGVTHIEI